MEDILHQVRTCGANTQEQWRKQIAASLAEQAAIPTGKNLTDSEMRDIVTRLMALPNYRRTADALVAFLDRHEDLAEYVMVAPTAVTVLADRLPALADAGDEGAALDPQALFRKGLDPKPF